MQAESNSTVKVHYTGKLDDGSIFDSSENQDPIEFTLGQGQLIPGFESAVVGLKVGDKTTIAIPPDEAYGQADARLVQQIERTQLPPEINLEKDLQLQSQTPDGEMMVLRVVEFDDQNVTLDANHPLAGQTLHFDIELIEVV